MEYRFSGFHSSKQTNKQTNGPWTWRYTHKKKGDRTKHTFINLQHGWTTHPRNINFVFYLIYLIISLYISWCILCIGIIKISCIYLCDLHCSDLCLSIIICFILWKHCALRTPEERLPSGALKEEFGWMIFQKKSSLGDRTKVSRQLLVEVRRGAGTCDAPCTLNHHCSSASL